MEIPECFTACLLLAIFQAKSRWAIRIDMGGWGETGFFGFSCHLKAKTNVKNMLKIILILFAICLCGCSPSKLPVKGSDLLGKTKLEVAEIALKKSPPASDGEKIIIGIVNANKSSTAFYFKDIGDVKKNKKLLDADIWTVCHKEVPFRFDGKTNYLVVEFKENRARRVKVESYSEF